MGRHDLSRVAREIWQAFEAGRGYWLNGDGSIERLSDRAYWLPVGVALRLDFDWEPPPPRIRCWHGDSAVGMTSPDWLRRPASAEAASPTTKVAQTVPPRPQLIAWALATPFSWHWLETGEAPRRGDPTGHRAPPVGLEPTTLRLTAECSAN